MRSAPKLSLGRHHLPSQRTKESKGLKLGVQTVYQATCPRLLLPGSWPIHMSWISPLATGFHPRSTLLTYEESMAGPHHFCTTSWARLSIDISYLVGLKAPGDWFCQILSSTEVLRSQWAPGLVHYACATKIIVQSISITGSHLLFHSWKRLTLWCINRFVQHLRE